jgi:hypothetical protein
MSLSSWLPSLSCESSGEGRVGGFASTKGGAGEVGKDLVTVLMMPVPSQLGIWGHRGRGLWEAARPSTTFSLLKTGSTSGVGCALTGAGVHSTQLRAHSLIN